MNHAAQHEYRRTSQDSLTQQALSVVEAIFDDLADLEKLFRRKANDTVVSSRLSQLATSARRLIHLARRAAKGNFKAERDFGFWLEEKADNVALVVKAAVQDWDRLVETESDDEVFAHLLSSHLQVAEDYARAIANELREGLTLDPLADRLPLEGRQQWTRM